MARVDKQLTEERIQSIIALCNEICVDFHVEADDIEIKTFGEGAVSEIYHVVFKTPTSDQNALGKPLHSVVVKFFEANRSHIDRVKSKTNSTLIGLHNLSPAVLLLRDTALVLEYIQGRPLTDDDDRDEHLFRQLAQKVARFHSLKVPIPRNDHKANVIHACDVWLPRARLNSHLYSGPVGEVLQRHKCTTLLTNHLADTTDFIKRCVFASQANIVYSHCDLNHFNIVLLEPDHQIRFIDFDYSGYHYRGCDFGKFFSECEHATTHEHELISDERMLQFIKYYIDECCVIHGESYLQDARNSPEQILKESKLFVLYALMINVLFQVWLAIEKEQLRDESIINAEQAYRMMMRLKKRFQEAGVLDN